MTDKVKSKTPISNEALLRKLAGKLDKEDNLKDDEISQDVYNDFATNIGIELTNNSSVSVDEAVANMDILIKNAPEILLNEYENRYGKRINATPPEEEPVTEKEKPKKQEDSVLGGLKRTWNGLKSGTSNWVKRQIDENVEDYIASCSVDEARDKIRSCANVLSDEYPMASKLLRLSVTPSEMLPGNYKGYRVLSPQQSKDKLKNLGMRENDANIYGKKVTHFTSDKMNFPMVEFSKDSNESKIVGKTKEVEEYVKYWLQDGKLSHKYYGLHLNETTDCKLGINSAIIGGMNYIDNGNSYTVSGYIEDVYDFDQTYYNYGSFITDRINRAACVAQQKGAIQNYRVLIPFEVTIQKSSIK